MAGLLERVDDAEANRVKADGVLKKPFEASAVLAAIRPLSEAAQAARAAISELQAPGTAPANAGPDTTLIGFQSYGAIRSKIRLLS